MLWQEIWKKTCSHQSYFKLYLLTNLHFTIKENVVYFMYYFNKNYCIQLRRQGKECNNYIPFPIFVIVCTTNLLIYKVLYIIRVPYLQAIHKGCKKKFSPTGC